MKEILEKIKNEINAIKKEQKNLEELTIQCDELKKQKKELETQRDEIGDPNSGFYQDVVQKIEEKNNEFIEANNERMNKNKTIEKLITEKKEEIKKHIADKKHYIDENRNVDKLKEEKEQLEREVELNNITREEFDTKTDAEKKEIRKAKENYLNNKHRLAEINPIIELIETLDGKDPKEKFMELNNLDKQIDTNFNKNGFDVILEELNKGTQTQTPPQTQTQTQTPPQTQTQTQTSPQTQTQTQTPPQTQTQTQTPPQTQTQTQTPPQTQTQTQTPPQTQTQTQTPPQTQTQTPPQTQTQTQTPPQTTNNNYKITIGREGGVQYNGYVYLVYAKDIKYGLGLNSKTDKELEDYLKATVGTEEADFIKFVQEMVKAVVRVF